LKNSAASNCAFLSARSPPGEGHRSPCCGTGARLPLLLDIGASILGECTPPTVAWQAGDGESRNRLLFRLNAAPPQHPPHSSLALSFDSRPGGSTLISPEALLIFVLFIPDLFNRALSKTDGDSDE
jgi:hypothetical protein